MDKHSTVQALQDVLKFLDNLNPISASGEVQNLQAIRKIVVEAINHKSNTAYIAVGIRFDASLSNSIGTNSKDRETVITQFSQEFHYDEDYLDEILLIDRELNVVEIWRRER